MNYAAMMLVAMALDLLIGWPAPLFARIGHPVTWIGKLISALDQSLNRETASPAARRSAGTATLILVTAAAALPLWLVQFYLPANGFGLAIGGILAWPLVALRSMYDHVEAVAVPLASGDLAQARFEVSMIVGRNTAVLDEAGVARAALESLAENTSDGVVAPLFWGALLGLPGIAGYKAINTLDSMIGHRTPRFTSFGWASARFDDLVNLAPARLSGLLFALVSPTPRKAIALMRRDAGLHRSPNAGWPEAAMAAALHIRLSGPRLYASGPTNEPWVNAGAPDPSPEALHSGLALYRRAMAGLAAALLVLALAVWGLQ
jgi:adenosylcobinamide-phosphate synthase